MLRHTPIHLRRAIEVSRCRGLENVSAHFEKKVREEEGHDRWADDDLSVWSSPTPPPFPAAIELVDYLAELIERDPRLYVVYIVTNEYFTVVAGSVWAQALAEGCGVPLSGLTAVTKHIEADATHAAEGFEALGTLVAEPELEPLARATVESTMFLFSKFFEQVIAA